MIYTEVIAQKKKRNREERGERPGMRRKKQREAEW